MSKTKEVDYRGEPVALVECKGLIWVAVADVHRIFSNVYEYDLPNFYEDKSRLKKFYAVRESTGAKPREIWFMKVAYLEQMVRDTSPDYCRVGWSEFAKTLARMAESWKIELEDSERARKDMTRPEVLQSKKVQDAVETLSSLDITSEDLKVELVKAAKLAIFGHGLERGWTFKNMSIYESNLIDSIEMTVHCDLDPNSASKINIWQYYHGVKVINDYVAWLDSLLNKVPNE